MSLISHRILVDYTKFSPFFLLYYKQQAFRGAITIKKQQKHHKPNHKKQAPAATGVTNYPIKEDAQLLPFLLENLKGGRNAIKAILTRGQVSVDGKTITQHNHPLKAGQVVSILSNQVAMNKTVLHGISILHEDDDLIVIRKDEGILSVSGKDPSEATAYRQLSAYVKESNKANRIFVVHRLDRDTSGVMIYAKTEAAKTKLQENWHEMVKERTYTALVEGETDNSGKISSWLTENTKSMKVHSHNYDNGGKHAVTHYKKIQGNKNYSLLEVQLETGRKNQIRVHMESIGHPVAGDKKYSARSNPLKRLGLHASSISFIHPTTNKLVSFTVKAQKGFYLSSKEV